MRVRVPPQQRVAVARALVPAAGLGRYGLGFAVPAGSLPAVATVAALAYE